MFRALPGVALPGRDDEPGLIDALAGTPRRLCERPRRVGGGRWRRRPQAAAASAPRGDAARDWFELGGDALSFGQPGLELPRRPLTGEPGAASYYFIREAGSTTDGPEADKMAARGPVPHPPFDVDAIRRDFPILDEQVHGRPLVWLDNAATTQKPQAVIDRLAHFYAHENSNIHRAAHELAARATDAYEDAREQVARLPGRAVSRRDRLRAWRHRGDQPGRAELGPPEHRRGRRDRDYLAGAPRQHRALAACWPRERARAAGDPGRRQRPDHARRVRAAARTAHPAGRRSRTYPTRWARSRRCGEMIEMAHGAAPSCWSTARRPSRTCRSMCRRSMRLLRPLRTQGLRPDRHRRRSTAAGRCSRRCRPGRAAAT